ncbi:carbohydrate porin [Bradyrhizobium japonicum]|uniref:carbohydrate porin n=1 Tax=Bradyrhizobium japonicum TaxID=375 RepID=UPI0034E51C87
MGLADARPHDKFGVSLAYAHVSPNVQALDRDFQAIIGSNWPIRTSEALLTTVYQYEVRSGITSQPNFQFVRHPGGGRPTRSMLCAGVHLKDASVFGLRTVVKF